MQSLCGMSHDPHEPVFEFGATAGSFQATVGKERFLRTLYPIQRANTRVSRSNVTRQTCSGAALLAEEV